MFDYTKAALSKIISDFRKIANGIKITTQLLSIAYLIYVLCTGKRFWIANTVLLTLSLGYFVFFFIVEMRKGRKQLKKTVKEIYGWSKRSIKFLTIGITVYGLVVSKIEFDPLSFLLVVLMVLGWVLELLFYIIIKFLEAEFRLLMDAAKTDAVNIPIIGNYVAKKMDVPDPTGKHMTKLDDMVQKARSQKALKKQQEKEEMKALKKLKKAEKRAAKKEQNHDGNA